MVLADRRRAVEKLGRGGALVGLEPAALAHPDKRVRLLGAGGDDAAWAVVLERPADHHLVGAEKRRGQRVAGIALHPAAVEAEGHRPRPVDQPAAFLKTRAHFQPSQSGRFALIFA